VAHRAVHVAFLPIVYRRRVSAMTRVHAMESCGREESMEQLLRRREAPCLVVLDQDYRIVSAELRLYGFFASVGCTQRDPERLPPEMEAAVVNLARHGRETGVAFPVAGVMLRTNVLTGPQGRCIAVTLERVRSRAPLDVAAERFGLSGREVQVLQLILRGYEAKAIAKELYIAESTVGEYFKHLSVKINARNRAEMIARVLDWRERPS